MLYSPAVSPAQCGVVSTEEYSSRERTRALGNIITSLAFLSLKLLSAMTVIIIKDSTTPSLRFPELRCSSTIFHGSLTHLPRVMVRPFSMLYSLCDDFLVPFTAQLTFYITEHQVTFRSPMENFVRICWRVLTVLSR